MSSLPTLTALSTHPAATGVFPKAGAPPDKKLKQPTAIKVLVLCHPNQFDDPVRPHWQRDIIKAKTEDDLFKEHKRDDFVYMTLDPSPSPDNHADFRSPLQSLFDPRSKFGSVPRFDIVWAPDCGGEWSEMLNLKGQERFDRLIELTLTMSRSLRPGGYLMLGKLFEVLQGDDAVAAVAVVADMKGARFVRAERVELPDPYTGERTLPYLLLQTPLQSV